MGIGIIFMFIYKPRSQYWSNKIYEPTIQTPRTHSTEHKKYHSLFKSDLNLTLIWDLGSKMAHHLPESNQNDPKKERMMRMIVTTMPWSRRGNGGWWQPTTCTTDSWWRLCNAATNPFENLGLYFAKKSLFVKSFVWVLFIKPSGE